MGNDELFVSLKQKLTVLSNCTTTKGGSDKITIAGIKEIKAAVIKSTAGSSQEKAGVILLLR